MTMEGNEHGGISSSPAEAAGDAHHLITSLWWKKNKAKPDNGASRD
jgi:hypothetical protein